MQITVEANREEAKQIAESIKQQFPDVEVRLLLKKNLTNFEEVQIIMSGIQILISVVALIYQIVPPTNNKNKVKIKIKDERGRTLSIDSEQADTKKIIEEFLSK